MPPMSRTLWLVAIAMLMFAGGVVVFVRANDVDEHVLAGAAILGALAIVVTSVNGKDRHD